MINTIKKSISIILLGCVSAFISCDNYTSYIEVVNDSDRPIMYVLSENDQLTGIPPYSQSQWDAGLKNINSEDNRYFVPAHSSTKNFAKSWESYVMNNCQDSTLRVFVFDPDVLQKHTWEKIKRGDMFLTRIKIDLEALKKAKWQVVYSDSLSFVGDK
jgi:hypothetical protein